MSELSINNLPAEILTEVFGYLNVENLMRATMTCKLWNNLIESAFRWSLKLRYSLFGELLSNNPDDAEQKMDFILTTNRMFGKIVIDGSHLIEADQIVEIFKRHGFNVVELRLEDCRLHNLTGIAELLAFTPNLKQVYVDIFIMYSFSDVLIDQLLPDLKKLKSLQFRGCDSRLMKCFRKAKLTTIEIWDYLHSGHLLADFLSTQNKLTSLTVASRSPSLLIEIGKLNVPIPFRLTHLSISGVTCQKPSQDYDHLMRFIESQAGNLTEIEMNDRISSSVYECVFANMTKLVTLSVKIKYLPRDYDFYGRLKENCIVHTLRLLDFGILDDQLVRNFLQKLPDVRCLILMYSERIDWVLAQSLSKLETLYICIIAAIPVDGVEFPNLKTLHIQYLCCKINWNQFTKAHPLLAELTIEQMDNCSYLTSDDIDQITTNVDLQHIRLGYEFKADNRFFEIVGSKCKNLKVLDLHESCISQNLEHYMKIDVFRLHDSIKCPKTFRAGFITL